jgi:hypothetical protein
MPASGIRGTHGIPLRWHLCRRIMKQFSVRRFGCLLALMIVSHAGVVWAQENAETMVSLKGPSPVMTAVEQCPEGMSAQRLSNDGVLVAEDIRCRQCRGKCAADNLRCRSQCLGNDACLTQCDEQKSTCEASCKQLFSCE